MAASKPAPTPPPTSSTGSRPNAAIPNSRASPPSRPSSRSIPEPSMPIVRPSIHGPISLPLPSTSNASSKPSVAIGASKACTGFSMSSSRTTSPDTGPGTAPRTWLSSDASRSASSGTATPKAASKSAENERHGTPNSCSRSSKSRVNLDSEPWLGERSPIDADEVPSAPSLGL
jgi:hypothetical protein